MVTTSARLLELLTLLQVRREWSGTELAGRLEVSERTVRRDVDRLRSLGYPIEARPGVAGYYRLAAGTELPPLLLDDDEAVAVAVGLRTAAVGTVAGIEETSVRALAKLEQVMPSRLRHRVAAFKEGSTPLIGGGPRIEAEVLTVIAAACRDLQGLRFRYEDRTGETSRRRVEPLSLVNTERRWYLLAWDLDRDDWRTFRVDRIEGPPSLDRRFPERRPPPEGVAEFVRKAISSGGQGRRLRVRFFAPAERIRAAVPPAYGEVEPEGPDACVLTSSASRLGWAAAHMANVGPEFEVLEPPELVEEMRALADRLAAAVRRR